MFWSNLNDPAASSWEWQTSCERLSAKSQPSHMKFFFVPTVELGCRHSRAQPTYGFLFGWIFIDGRFRVILAFEEFIALRCLAFELHVFLIKVQASLTHIIATGLSCLWKTWWYSCSRKIIVVHWDTVGWHLASACAASQNREQL